MLDTRGNIYYFVNICIYDINRTIEMAIPAERAFFDELLPTGSSLVKNAR